MLDYIEVVLWEYKNKTDKNNTIVYAPGKYSKNFILWLILNMSFDIGKMLNDYGNDGWLLKLIFENGQQLIFEREI